MSNDIAVQGTTLPAAFRAGGKVLAIVPQTMAEAWEIANIVVRAGIAPEGVDTPEKAMVAIMTGAEVGMPPMMAMQSIAVINKRPTIWGDGALGLVRSSGLLELIEEHDEILNGSLTAVCTVKRRNEAPVTRTFSMEEAITAGLINKAIWKLYPNRMLQMRARAFALRDVFADVLKGLGIGEEVRDYQMKDVTPTAIAQGSSPVSQKAPAGPPAHLFEETEQAAAPVAVAVPTEPKEAETLPPAIARAQKAKAAKVIDNLPNAGSEPSVFLRYCDDTLKVLQPGDDQGYIDTSVKLSSLADVTSASQETTTTMMEIMRTHERRMGLGG